MLDLDGTLYHQLPLRVAMAAELAWSAARGDIDATGISILRKFRKHREVLAGLTIRDAAWRQYADVAKAAGVTEDTVARIVQEWMFQRPLKHLHLAAIGSARRFIDAARTCGMKIGVLSDYPPEDKLRRLGICVDACHCTLDMPSSVLKPHPGPLIDLLHIFEVAPEATLVVGDREDRDGAMAHAAGCPFVLARGSRTFTELHATLLGQVHHAR